MITGELNHLAVLIELTYRLLLTKLKELEDEKPKAIRVPVIVPNPTHQKQAGLVRVERAETK